MSRITYRATPRSCTGEYGVSARDEETRRSAVTMPFLGTADDARKLAARLTREQMPLAEFCARFLDAQL